MAGSGHSNHPTSGNAKRPLAELQDLRHDFDALDQAIARLPLPQAELDDASYQPFISLVYLHSRRQISPSWTQVKDILRNIFGEADDAKVIEVPLGELGILALRETVGIASGEKRDEASAKFWLHIIKQSVDHTSTLIRARQPVPSTIPPADNGASFSHRERTSSVSANSPNPTRCDSNLLLPTDDSASLRSPQLNSPPRSHTLSVNPNLETTEQPSAQPGGRATSKRLREKGVSPENSSEEKPETRKRNKGKGRAEESSETDANGKGKGREGQGQIPKRVTRSSSGGDGGSKREKEKEETPRQISSTPTMALRNNREVPALRRPQLSPEEQLVRSVFPSIPLDIKLSSTSTPRPPHIDFETPFERPDIGGGPQVIDNPGTRGKNWALNRNHLCIRTSLNLCKLATSAGNTRLFAPGEPIVIPIEMSAGKVHRTFIANPEVGKHRSVVNVWIKDQDEDSWLYRGLYEIAYDGSEEENVEYLPVPTGSEEKVRIHTELERLVKEHATKKKKDETTVRLERALEDWGFEARNREAAVLEMGTRNEGDRRKHVKYIALRCVGWDEESWRIWTRKRNKRLRIAN